MGLRLIRANSDTPNVSNADDARMVRYAYGGYSGFVQGKGSELKCVPNGSTLTINSGVIVLQGWEVEIDSNGWSMKVSENNTEPLYFTVYCEVNLSLGTAASIKSTYDNSDYPTIEHGDDLTAIPNGIARIEICHFKAQSGEISEIEKIIVAIPYVKNELAIMNQRLDEMGFKEASVENGAINLQDGWADADTSEVKVFKMAKFVILKKLYLGTKSKVTVGNIGSIVGGNSLVTWGAINDISGLISVIPEGFRPKTQIEAYGYVSVAEAGAFGRRNVPVVVRIKTNGEVSAYGVGSYVRNATLLPASNSNPSYIGCENIGWEID